MKMIAMILLAKFLNSLFDKKVVAKKDNVTSSKIFHPAETQLR